MSRCAVLSSATQLSMTLRGYSSKQASTVMMIYAFLEICSAAVVVCLNDDTTPTDDLYKIDGSVYHIW